MAGTRSLRSPAGPDRPSQRPARRRGGDRARSTSSARRYIDEQDRLVFAQSPLDNVATLVGFRPERGTAVFLEHSAT